MTLILSWRVEGYVDLDSAVRVYSICSGFRGRYKCPQYDLIHWHRVPFQSWKSSCLIALMMCWIIF